METKGWKYVFVDGKLYKYDHSSVENTSFVHNILDETFPKHQQDCHSGYQSRGIQEPSYLYRRIFYNTFSSMNTDYDTNHFNCDLEDHILENDGLFEDCLDLPDQQVLDELGDTLDNFLVKTESSEEDTNDFLIDDKLLETLETIYLAGKDEENIDFNLTLEEIDNILNEGQTDRLEDQEISDLLNDIDSIIGN
ncbi:uncharacterized protein LOC111619622 isoform X1 [Centruroides sculpturatus]|uniref:uncharacterized protein LOC111619622 isoform X1 n=1 Tax=Centruroides sculpturatus TaxID=218467 RepID=UPI000C6DD024|nr:uncharacterized protein LOC111619622 isoform X1 [Centruroides sculpturatus]